MEIDHWPPLPFPRYRFEATLVDDYLHQRGEDMVSPLEVHTLYEGLTVDIEMLLTSEAGRDGLFPNLINRPNVPPQRLEARRTRAAGHLEMLFAQHVAIGWRPAAEAMRTVRHVFRRTAVLQAERPDLLEGEPRRFDPETIWPRLVIPVVEPEPAAPSVPADLPAPSPPSHISVRLTGVRNTALRERLDTLFTTYLAEPEQVALMMIFGLDGRPARNYRMIAESLGITPKTARALVGKTLSTLRRSGAASELEEFVAQAAELPS